jgi:hypothetical protein
MAFDGDDFGKVLKYPFQDPQWFSKMCVQGAVLLVLSFMLVGIPFSAGYMVVCAQKAINGDNTLPGWDEWGTFWKLGWKAIGVYIVYSLPLIALYVFVLMGYAVLGIDSITADIVFSILGFILSYGVTFLYSIAMIFVQSAALSAIAIDRSFSECLEINTRLWPYIKANFGSILLALIATWVAGILAYLGLFIFFIGLLFTFNYYSTITGYANGLVYKKSKVKL